MDINNKLEVFRKVYNLGLRDIERAMERSYCKEHLIDKYKYCRDKDGFHGNFTFLFQLDEHNAKLLFDYIGFN